MTQKASSLTRASACILIGLRELCTELHSRFGDEIRVNLDEFNEKAEEIFLPTLAAGGMELSFPKKVGRKMSDPVLSALAFCTHGETKILVPAKNNRRRFYFLSNFIPVIERGLADMNEEEKLDSDDLEKAAVAGRLLALALIEDLNFEEATDRLKAPDIHRSRPRTLAGAHG